MFDNDSKILTIHSIQMAPKPNNLETVETNALD